MSLTSDMYPLVCDTCGTIGTEDDGIEVGGPCAWEHCSGTVLFRDHEVYLHKVIHESDPVEITEDGNVVPKGREEIIDIDSSWLSCEQCGQLATDELAAHGISEYWEER